MNTFKQFLAERQVIANIRLTHHQRQVLAIMLSTPDGTAHDEEISNTPNLAKAREVLTNLKMILPTEGDVLKVTELGQKTAETEGIVADGQLTSDGQQLATSDAAPPPSGRPSQTPSDKEPPTDMPGLDVADAADTLPESTFTGTDLMRLFLTSRDNP